MQSRRDIFQAVADPTRRQILSMLLQEPRNLNSLAGEFDMTRQAISLHVKILQECQAIQVQKEGREKYCSLNLNTMTEIADWLEPFRQLWEQRFSKLDNLLEEMKKKS